MDTQNTSQTARVSRPHRTQIEMQMLSLDQMLPADHRARIVWAFVKSINLDAFYSKLQVTDDTPGRTAIAPEVLLGVWLLGTLDGIGSARELNRRCQTDLPYLWMLGNVTVNYHTLADFKSLQGEEFLTVMADTIAILIEQGVVSLDTIAQDGMRVRASAGKSSFRRKPTLEELRKTAREHIDRLNHDADGEGEPADPNARKKAAKERAAREREERVAEALRQYEKLCEQREKRKKGDGAKTRVSTTDPDARTMKMANGGYDPAYSTQFQTDADSRMIVNVAVTNNGTDGSELPPMLDELKKLYGKVPSKVLADSAYATQDTVTRVEQGGTKMISTIPRGCQLEKHGKDPHARQRHDTDEYVEFRSRMAEPENQELYKKRPSIAEFPNAECRNRNLKQFRVRGLVKVKAVAVLHALAFNLMRMINLGVLTKEGFAMAK